MYENIDDACPNCGSQKLTPEGVYIGTTGSYDKFQCNDCGKWVKSSKSNLTSKTSGI